MGWGQSRCDVQGDPACSQYQHPSLGQLRQMPEPAEGAESATAPSAGVQVSSLCFVLLFLDAGLDVGSGIDLFLKHLVAETG